MKQKVLSTLDDLNINYHLVDHPAVYTIADLAALPGNIAPVKNLLVQEEGGGRKFLVVIAGHARMDQKLIRAQFGTKRFRFADDATLMDTLGVAPGSVSIFGLLNNKGGNVEVIIDEELMRGGAIGFHPNDNTATVEVTPSDLVKFLQSINKAHTVMKLY